MKISTWLVRAVTAFVVMTASAAAQAGVTIYFDNANKKWTNPYCHYWGGTSASTYPGAKMTLYKGTVWKIDAADGTKGCLFNAGDGDATKTGDFDAKDGYVYTESGSTGKTITEYLSENPGPGPIEEISYTVWFDNKEGWSQVWTWIWTSSKNYTGGSWPGMQIYKQTNGYYKYTFTAPADAKLQVLFNNGTDQKKTGDYTLADGHIYTTAGDQGHISAYGDPGPVEPEDPVEYKVWFQNNKAWPDVKAYVWVDGQNPAKEYKGSWPGTLLGVDPANGYYVMGVTALKGEKVMVQFNEGLATQACRHTSDLELIDNHVYYMDGDGGDASTYVPRVVEPDPVLLEYWLEPEKPKQNEQAVLHFNRTLGDGKLKNTDEIWVYMGTVNVGGKDSDWQHVPNWGSLPDKYKMTRVGTSDEYTLTFSPTIEGWFGMDSEERASKIAVIFRDKGGNTKQDSGTDDGNHYLELTQLPAPPPDPTNSNLGMFESYADNDGTIEVTGSKGTLFITPWAPEIVKVFTLKKGASARTERRSISVVEGDQPTYGIPEADYSITDRDDELEIAVDGGVTVKVAKAGCFVSFWQDGVELLGESAGLVNASAGGKSTVSFRGMGDAAFYGGGYNGKWTDISDHGLSMNNTQTGNWTNATSAPHNINIPYYVSASGYGVYFDDHTRGAVMNASPSGSTWTSSSATPMAYYFLGGGTMERAMQNYTMLTGRPQLPPHWALGYISSKFSFETETEARNVITKTRGMKIPLDGIVFDIHWQGHPNGMGRLDWNTSAYPSGGAKIMADFKAQNVNTIAITEPYFAKNCGNYDTANNAGYFSDADVNGMSWMSDNGPAGLLDPTNEAALDWMYGFYKKQIQNGMDAWWYDLGEPERHDGDATYKEGTIEQVHNEYNDLWVGGIQKRIMRDFPDKRWMAMPRSGTAGMQRYGAFPWTGDIQRSWGGLQAQVPALVNASMAGVGTLGSDIGGFIATGTDPDLYRRWVQLGILYPSMRTHSAVSPEPFADAYSGIAADVRKAIRQRYAYLPYNYTLMWDYCYNGTPTARPANFADSDKTRLANETDSYLWGRDIFVAPVLTTSDTRTINFPDGDWLDLNTGEIYRNATTYTAAKNVLPHFLRRGAFVTTYSDSSDYGSSADMDKSKIAVDYFVNKTSALDGSNWYEDNHTNAEPVGSGDYMLTRFKGFSDYGHIQIVIEREGNGYTGMPAVHDMTLRLHDHQMASGDKVYLRTYNAPESGPQRAQANTELTRVNDPEALTAGSYYADGRNVQVRFNADPTQKYSLIVGSNPTFTGIEAPAATGALTLSWGGGLVSWSAPEGISELALEVTAADGTAISRHEGLKADGTVHQMPLKAGKGVYILRLSGVNSEGIADSKCIKAVM